MKKNLYLSLAAIMIIFALCISLTLTTYYYMKMKQSTIAHEKEIIDEKISQLLFAVETSDKVIYHFGNSIAQRIHNNSKDLNSLYEQKPSFSDWDFNALSEQYKMDIYIINEQNIIEFSNVDDDVGLNFNACCSSLARVLDERRLSNQFFHDGLDAEQSTGELKKYSYMSTFDKKYLIQLGVYWKNSGFYNDFEFDYVANRLIDDRIKYIRLLNSVGHVLGEDANYTLLSENKAAFKKAIETKSIVELKTNNDQASLSYFYVPYLSSYDQGFTNKKAIEVVYDQTLLDGQLNKNAKLFFIQITFILVVTIILAMLIAKKFSAPIFLAFHDPLTKLGNRAYLQEYANHHLLKNKSFALIIVDIDNFKWVNDCYGHAMGDEVIKQTANLIADYNNFSGYSFRLGGDEFVTIINTNNRVAIMKHVDNITTRFKSEIAPLYPNEETPLSLSIGVAFSIINGQHLDDILHAADEALYTAKKTGKDQYVITKQHT